ncbi:MAG TPA: hypothetical protein PK048_02075 [Candidatus Absconditabacterales bacterium]|nr:hypothetical protein [Candidatus Absconditabacterales bacterium]
MKKIIISLLVVGSIRYGSMSLFQNISYGADFQLVPAVDDSQTQQLDQATKNLTELKPGENFWDKYNQEQAKIAGNKKVSQLAACVRTGICGREVILDLGVYILRFIMQLALVIGALMIIKSGYEYAMTAFGVKDGEKNFHSSIKNALIGLFVISISYTIIKLLQMAFLN